MHGIARAESSVDMMVGVLKYEQLNALMMASAPCRCIAAHASRLDSKRCAHINTYPLPNALRLEPVVTDEFESRVGTLVPSMNMTLLSKLGWREKERKPLNRFVSVLRVLEKKPVRARASHSSI